MLQASCAGRLDRVVLHELVDQVVAGEAADGQHQQPHDEHADRERTELEPAAPARQPDRERGDRKRDEPHPVGDGAQDLRDRLRRLELALLDDRDLPRGLGHPLGDLPDHRHLVSELDHDRTQVEHDRAALGLDEGRVVVEQAHELALRPASSPPPTPSAHVAVRAQHLLPDLRPSARDRPEPGRAPAVREAAARRSPPRRRRSRTACRPTWLRPVFGSRRSRSCSERSSRSPPDREPCSRHRTRPSPRARAGSPERSARVRR